MDITGLIIQLVAGAIGGNAGGMLAKARSLGPLLNTILGAVGGLGGGQLVGPMLGGGTPATVGASAVIGALLPIIGGFLKQKA